MHGILTSTWFHKNGPWPGNTSLLRDKLSQLVLDLLPCVRISFPVSYSRYTPLLGLSVCTIWHLANPTAISVPFWEGTGSFCYSTRWMHTSQLPYAYYWEGFAGHERLCPLLKLIFFCLFSMWVKHFSSQCLAVLFSLVTVISRYSWQKCSDFYSW